MKQRERKLEGGVGQVMQKDVENIVDEMLRDFDKESLKKTTEKNKKTVQNKIANSNTMIVYDNMDSEVEANEV